MKEYIQKLVQNQSLTADEAETAISKIFTEANDAQIAAFLTALKMKGETPPEIAGLARGMKKAANIISPKVAGILVDTCGTGGDSTGTINVSTGAAIVAAGAGVPVAKHGNYSITSKSGSADVLKELGVTIDLSPKDVENIIEKVGIGFMLAPVFHPSMKRVAQIRRDLGFRTVFNILGPLTNPANAKAQVIGVFDSSLCETMANVLNILGTKRAFVVHGSGMDEISNTGETQIVELNNSRITKYTVTPEKLGVKRASISDIAGGTPEENASDIVEVLKGKMGAKRDIIVINAGAALLVSGKADTLASGIKAAAHSIDSGAALNKLKDFVSAAGDPEKLARFL
ncbi:MAG: anthranilate phosphoribosyltransferase [Candidatus Methanoperedens sp.]|nr:anthranilate phosphoribosyltransferase [Candidatus Methanoperedens sp.]MCZ7396681.1 anthranilate phosphoribosyltransferase [Candidatus Methanoperedens sp.]